VIKSIPLGAPVRIVGEEAYGTRDAVGVFDGYKGEGYAVRIPGVFVDDKGNTFPRSRTVFAHDVEQVDLALLPKYENSPASAKKEKDRCYDH